MASGSPPPKLAHPASPDGWRGRAHTALEASRARLLALVGTLEGDALTRPHSALMSPIIWDVAHIANYEEQWLVRALGAEPLAGPDVDALYDAFQHPRSTRAALPLLEPEEAFEYARRVRTRALELLAGAPTGSAAPLLRGGFVYGMVAQHEQQHVETLLATLQLMTHPPSTLAGAPLPSHAAPYTGPSELFHPGGTFVMGSDAEWAYDNERPAHEARVQPFFLDVTAVTNGAYREFMADGGYTRRELWCEAGWAHAQAEALAHPLFWSRAGSGWTRRRFGTLEPVPDREPVQHVCFYEAAAYARWKQRRLPTEAEWEVAAAGAPDTVPASNLGGIHTRPRPASLAFGGQSRPGALQMLGDVWEWTSSDFQPYPGFVAFPYREYSEVFFGTDYKVLRGGAWGVAPVTIRTTFRNWDFPIRRQIFTGFRCARDA